MIFAMSRIIKPSGARRAYQIGVRLPRRGREAKIGAGRELRAAQRLQGRINLLVRAHVEGDPPPPELSQWIANLDDRLFKRLVHLGLLDRRRREAAKPISEHIDDYEKAVAARKSNTALHARKQAQRVRRVMDALKIEVADEIKQHDVVTEVKSWSLADATRRHYLVAVCDFCKWMVRDKRMRENPMLDTPLPSAEADTQHNRRPLTLEEFRKLAAHLKTFGRHHQQKARWTALDRRLIYWTAVKTALRLEAMRALTVDDLRLEGSPATIRSWAKHQKNKTEHEVPIPPDLAQALKTYTRRKLPTAKVFPFPRSAEAGTLTLRRDLDAAGVDWSRNPHETVDFHTLRSTAITWWLVHDRLDQLTVARLANLKTLRLVQKYSQNFRMENFAWLNQTPSVEAQVEAQPKRRRKGAG